jgi:4'-phosphopantetheinyl transferase
VIWEPTRPPAALADDEIHLWRFALGAGEPELRAMSALLHADERARAARFRFERDRRRFVVARARLRQILGAYLGRPPDALTFDYGPRGKPSLPGIDFNLAHSHELALLAVMRGGGLGVDVEEVRLDVPVEDVARYYFSAAERSALRGLADERQKRAFFDCWTRKEAYLKAIGEGLWLPLDSFTVSVDGPAALIEVRDRPDEAARWWLESVDAGDGYAAADALRLGDGQSPPRLRAFTPTGVELAR